MRCFALICLAALCGAAAARELTAFDVAAHGRELLQTSTECSRSVANCETCTFRTVGSTTRAICTKCAAGYVVKASGRACWCAAGYYNSAGTTCSACTNGYWCPGSKSTLASARRTSCGGTGKTTTTATAKSVRECVTEAGYGWTTGLADATQCPVGFFNPGGNQRKCTACPGGMTTGAAQSTSAASCVAPAGYYYQRGKAVACAQGTYKAAAGNTDCTPCPEGFTTAAGAVGKTAATDCQILLPGYSVIDGTVGTQAGELCAADTYRTGTATYTGTAIPCSTCPANMKTQEGVTGATSIDQCFVPPGYGFVSIGSGATQCVAGEYNPGWNRDACSSCPTGMTTDAAGAEDDDECYTPAGYGNAVVSGSRQAFACPLNTYGRANRTYGLVDVECHKCPDHSNTTSTGSQSIASCLVEPGYGYYDGAVIKCEYGTYNAGGNQFACQSCGDNYNTTTDTSSPLLADATDGADSQALCVVDAGWYFTNNADNTGGLSPCPRGTYKNALGGLTSAACLSCPAGITTSILLANQFQSDCDACKPGYGITGGVINLANPVCDQCTSSFYSVGYAQGGQECQACPVPTGGEYTGAMVSRPGTITPEDCIGQFVTDGNRTNGLEYNMISMADASLTAKASTTKELCQSTCASDDTCQYYVFFTYPSYANGTEGGSTQCYHRLAGAAIDKVADHTWATGSAATDKYYVLFEAKSGLYAVYEAVGADPAAQLADAQNVGTQLATYSSFADAKTACDTNAACIGMSNTGPTAWRTFSGKAWGFTDSRVKYYGNNLNSWIA